MARATFKKGAKVSRWEANLANPSAALKQIGVLMVAESRRAFTEQRFGAKPWQPRAPVNIFGIIADFHQGKKAPPNRRFERRPALRDTGRLAGSIAFRLIGTSVVEVGSNLPYAGAHHTGGEVESQPITQKVRAALWKWLRNKGPELKRRLGWLLNKKFIDQRLTMEVPKRPLVGITRQTRAYVREAVGVKIMEAR